MVWLMEAKAQYQSQPLFAKAIILLDSAPDGARQGYTEPGGLATNLFKKISSSTARRFPGPAELRFADGCRGWRAWDGGALG